MVFVCDLPEPLALFVAPSHAWDRSDRPCLRYSLRREAAKRPTGVVVGTTMKDPTDPQWDHMWEEPKKMDDVEVFCSLDYPIIIL
jgi:hypothetical protein